MYMFRGVFFNKRNIVLTRSFSDRKLPTVIWTDKFITKHVVSNMHIYIYINTYVTLIYIYVCNNVYN